MKRIYGVKIFNPNGNPWLQNKLRSIGLSFSEEKARCIYFNDTYVNENKIRVFLEEGREEIPGTDPESKDKIDVEVLEHNASFGRVYDLEQLFSFSRLEKAINDICWSIQFIALMQIMQFIVENSASRKGWISYITEDYK